MRERFDIELEREGATRMTCQEAGCKAHLEGWVTILPPAQDDLAHWIRTESRREYREIVTHPDAMFTQATAPLGITVTPELQSAFSTASANSRAFFFPPGQQCFKPHLDREVTFSHTAGGIRRLHNRALDWMEHFNERMRRS